jgi:threonine dehydrogenase-like Zn-dependent dehydrogenase
MSFLSTGEARYPLRIGHEWIGRIVAIPDGADGSLLGRRVTADTMIGCGVCHRCLSGRSNVCEFRFEIGVRGGWPGALAEQLPVPISSLFPVPDSIPTAVAAMIEPAGNAARAVDSASIRPDDLVLVLGPGTIGLLSAQFARASGAKVHVAGPSAEACEFASSLGFAGAWMLNEIPSLPWTVVIDASNGTAAPGEAIRRVEPGGTVVLVGVAGATSEVDARDITLKDLRVRGILGGRREGMSLAIDRFISGEVDPTPLVCGTVPLEGVAAMLAGDRFPGAGPGPKVLVDPTVLGNV